ncbi:hypothetical protein P3633_23560 [Vibrio parahaemolyticus]|nr:hypothetical protein [Vibrio parahaemolyticus]MDF5316783.1 hypothetical protein [Vibrio parahaemolyticus]MDF5341172.1 hypothetical protein [Vibrio parahaemolyticus]MDF5351158.1 hypothetical protein [Vibrio parahaemolyticus]MDF5462067.1 hypothetical protein [Vibrio parahaemolyticus]
MFFGAATFGLTELNFFAETLLFEFVCAKADLLAEMTFSLVWKIHVVSLSSRFETKPDLSASKHLKLIVCKV